MPELGTLGSVRGDASNGIPYRDGGSGCGSKWGGLDIVGGHSRIQGSEQIMKRTIQPKLNPVQFEKHGF